MIKIDSPETLLANGLKDTWYAICPSSFITDKPVSLRRLGMKLVFWRDQAGKLYAALRYSPNPPQLEQFVAAVEDVTKRPERPSVGPSQGRLPMPR